MSGNTALLEESVMEDYVDFLAKCIKKAFNYLCNEHMRVLRYSFEGDSDYRFRVSFKVEVDGFSKDLVITLEYFSNDIISLICASVNSINDFYLIDGSENLISIEAEKLRDVCFHLLSKKVDEIKRGCGSGQRYTFTGQTKEF
jgi:hypothetical protein